MAKPQAWHPEDIKSAIRKTGVTMAALARARGVSPSTVFTALRHPSPAGEIVIAEHLGLEPQALWPDRYEADGTPKHPRASRGLYRAKAFRNPGLTRETA